MGYAIYSGYDPSTLTHDIALIKTIAPILFSAFDDVAPVCMPKARFPDDGDLLVTAIGWGRTSNTGPGSFFLMEVRAKYTNICKKKNLFRVGAILFQKDY